MIGERLINDMNLPIVFGKASNGEEVIRDLVRLPYLLIGGLTGFGKSVFLNSLIFLESMYSRALDLVRTTRRASTSWFQRQLNIGYNDALKVISLLEERGAISQVNDKGAREILVEDNRGVSNGV